MSVFGNTASIASLNPVRLSVQAMRISSMPVTFAFLSSSRMSSRLASSSGVLFLPISFSSIRLLLFYTIHGVYTRFGMGSHNSTFIGKLRNTCHYPYCGADFDKYSVYLILLPRAHSRQYSINNSKFVLLHPLKRLYNSSISS